MPRGPTPAASDCRRRVSRRARSARSRPTSRLRIGSRLLREVLFETAAQIDHGLQSEAGGALSVVFPGLLEEVGAGDIQMRPGQTLGHELSQEESGGDRSGMLAPDVVEIRIRGFQRLLVFFDQGKLPEYLAIVLAGTNDRLHEMAVISHHSRHPLPHPAMPPFMVNIPSGGFSEMPPVSQVIPFPTKAR